MNKLKILTVLFFVLVTGINVSAQIFVDWNSQWSYFKGVSEPSQPNTLWTGANFNDSSWPKGNAPFHYGDGQGGTELADMFQNYSTCYTRKTFIVDNVNAIDDVIISLDYDDGFIVWINDVLVLQKNAPTNHAYDRLATFGHESGEPESFIFDPKSAGLVSGSNIVAIQGFNTSLSSTDFMLHFKIEGTTKLPETEGMVTCDTPSGFFNNPFTAKLIGTTPGETIKYTVDGSDPRTSLNVLSGTSPVSVRIDPASTIGGRGLTGGFVLRASKYQEGLAPGRPITNTYIFVAAVKSVTAHPGGNWPTFNVNGQTIDLPMDTKVTEDPRYKNLMETSLLDIPTISVTTDPANLFDSNTGIYVNAEYHGSEWERPANAELINPDGSKGFNIDAGLRIRGGYSRHDGYPKHAFRLFFRSEYGESKLDFPLFGDEGVNEFDKVDLRTSQNYSWANGGGQSTYNTMNRDVFSRDSQRDLNVPYTRSRYYHLYLNGLYWGVYQTQERSEASYAESYFGGDKDEYDVIKVDVGENFNVYEVEATDGNLLSWNAIWNMCEKGFSSNADYFNLFGLTSTGAVDTSLTVWIDEDNLIDYMLTIFYGGNFDAPVSKFSNNFNPNNFYAIDNRERKRDGFKFFAHDAEHTILKDPVGPGEGIAENRVNINMNVNYFGKFHPQWLHYKLTENAEYRMKFADRVYRHFFNNGVFTPDSCIARFKKTSDKLKMAIIAESARWGDSGSFPARTKDDDWIPAVKQVTDDYMPFRTDIVLDQLLAANLYVSLKPPVYTNNGSEIITDKITISENYNLTLENKNTTGSIFYTTDGTDPRVIGGESSNSAVNGGKSKTITVAPGTTVKSRVRYAATWSAVHELVFENSGLFTDLKVTEVHYHPVDQDTVGAKQLEFIELKNIGTKTLDLSGLSFTDGITYTFPNGTIIAPKSFVVVASNPVEFQRLYGFSTDHGFSGSLSNGGEHIELQTSTNQVVISFTYYDTIPWPVEPDGDGYSLISAETNPTGDPNNVEYWAVSKYMNGSPMTNDEGSIVTAVASFATPEKPDFSLYPNPASSSVNIDFSLANNGEIEIGLYDLNGRLLKILVNEQLPFGDYSKNVSIGNLNLTEGMYLITLRSENSFATKKLIYKK